MIEKELAFDEELDGYEEFICDDVLGIEDPLDLAGALMDRAVIRSFFHEYHQAPALPGDDKVAVTNGRLVFVMTGNKGPAWAEDVSEMMKFAEESRVYS